MTTDFNSSPEIVFDGLSFPTSLAIDADGALYVLDFGAFEMPDATRE